MVSREHVGGFGVARVPAFRVVTPLLILQVDLAVMLWLLDALNQITEQTFAFFVAIQLLAFSMVSYAYRHSRNYATISRAWMIVGSVALLALLFSALIFVCG